MTTDLRPVERHLIGTAHELATLMSTEHAQGRLVRWTPPQRLTDDQYAIALTVLEPPPRRVVLRRRLRLAVRVTAVVAALGVLAVVGWGVFLLVQWVMGHLVLIALGAIVALAGAGASVKSEHCPGCGHR